ncbi:ATP-binding protein [Pseudomonas sp. 10B1]|uniref:ATP-binding protein n=1 Tax=Pseudomonas sp. 10B1 TaxID=3048573 RepID=UPI002B232E96|nr:ATP-binding protein [Pseudomonas sp. 10B1]MEB0308341.1 ATP-binding protein [Pseudomonas sp. 10B1]
MKLNPDDYFYRQRRISRHRAIASARKSNKATKNKIGSLESTPTPRYINAPAMIGLHTREMHLELTKFLSALRKECTKNPSVRINFGKTVKVFSVGTLLMLAEIERIYLTLKGKCKLTCTYPTDDTVEKVFQQIGLFQIIGKEHRLKITDEDTSVIHWRYASGVSVNPKDADILLKAIRGKIPQGYLRLVTGVSEAMDNAVHHAYIRPRGDRLSGMEHADDRRWWVFAQVLDGRLSVIFCDLGLGIPVTLPERWAEQIGDILRLTSLSPGKRDMRMIRRALELGRTRTDQNHRGKGLARNILKAAQELNGRLYVYSNMGVVGVDFKGGAPSYTQGAFDKSILGTVIQWSVPITDTQDLEHENDENDNF